MPKTKYTKSKDGRYRKRVKVGYYENGNPKYKPIYGYTVRELEENYAEFINNRKKGLVIENDKISLKEWASKWLIVYKGNEIDNTYAMYENCVNNHINKSDIAMIPVCKIKPIQIQEFLNKTKEIGENIANKVGMTLNQILEQAIENHIIIKNPMKKIKIPSQPEKEKRALIPAEEEAINNIDVPLKHRVFTAICQYTGLRRGETLALTVFDFDFKRKRVRVNKNLVFKGNKGVIKDSPKTDAGNRYVPIPERLCGILRDYFKTLNGIYLFTMESGEMTTRSSYTKMWNKIRNSINKYIDEKNEKASTPMERIQKPDIPITAHILRHTYATYLYYAGVDIKTAQKWLGHKSVTTTLKIYTHLEDESENAERKLNDYFDFKENDKKAV